MRVELSKFVGLRNAAVVEQLVRETIDESERKDDPIYISDFLVADAWEQAIPIIRELRQDTRELYTLHCLRDEWGNIPQPGDTIIRKMKRDMVKDGRPITSKQENQMIAHGTYDKYMFREKKFTVDEKGCIKCNFADAEYFLGQFGVHSYSNTPISGFPKPVIDRETGEPLKLSPGAKWPFTKEELSEHPAKAPDGNYLHVWYWRFKECDSVVYPYDKLPVLDSEKEEKPKRGHSARQSQSSVSV